MRETSKVLCVVFLFTFGSVAKPYEISVLRAMSYDYDIDKFEIPTPVCARISCARLGGSGETEQNKRCSCVCSATNNTFGTYPNRLGCFNPKTFVREEGCDIFFQDTPPLKTVKADSYNLLKIAASCQIEKVQYLTCGHEWVSVGNSQKKQFAIISVEGPSYKFALKVSANVRQDVLGKIIKLSVQCSNRTMSTCLMFKFTGQTRCNIAVEEPISNATPTLSMAPPTGSSKKATVVAIHPLNSNPSSVPIGGMTEPVTSSQKATVVTFQPLSSNPSYVPDTSSKKLTAVTVQLLSSTTSSVAVGWTALTKTIKPTFATTVLETSATQPKQRSETPQGKARDWSVALPVVSGIVGAVALTAFVIILGLAVRRRHFRKLNLTRETSRDEIGEENYGAAITDDAHVEVIDNRGHHRQEHELPPPNQNLESVYAAIGMSIPKKESKVEGYEFLGKDARRTSNADYARLYDIPVKQCHLQPNINIGADLSKGDVAKVSSIDIRKPTHDCAVSTNHEYQVLEGPDPNMRAAKEPKYHVLEGPDPNMTRKRESCCTPTTDPLYYVLEGPEPNASSSSKQ